MPHLQMDNATFLHWVQGREERYELAAGRVVTTTRGTMRHALVVGNLFDLLRRGLDQKRWSVLCEFGIDVSPGTIRYADIMVDERGAKGDVLTAKAPELIAEVLSPSTTTIDLGDKAAEYLRLPSLVSYLVFAQDEVKAWVYCRGGEKQFLAGPQVVSGPEASISIPALNVNLTLIDVYAGIDFD
jgi:Uma2 family endonuclease